MRLSEVITNIVIGLVIILVLGLIALMVYSVYQTLVFLTFYPIIYTVAALVGCFALGWAATWIWGKIDD